MNIILISHFSTISSKILRQNLRKFYEKWLIFNLNRFEREYDIYRIYLVLHIDLIVAITLALFAIILYMLINSVHICHVFPRRFEPPTFQMCKIYKMEVMAVMSLFLWGLHAIMYVKHLLGDCFEAQLHHLQVSSLSCACFFICQIIEPTSWGFCKESAYVEHLGQCLLHVQNSLDVSIIIIFSPEHHTCNLNKLQEFE